VIVFNKIQKASKHCDHPTIRHIERTQRLVTKVEKKIEDILGEGQFEFRKGKGNGMQLGS